MAEEYSFLSELSEDDFFLKLTLVNYDQGMVLMLTFKLCRAV